MCHAVLELQQHRIIIIIMRMGTSSYLIVGVLEGHRLKLRKALAKPGGHWALHVNGKGLEAFLEATDGKKPQGAHILAQVQVAHLTRPQAADGQEA